jgi:hypothetical protein
MPAQLGTLAPLLPLLISTRPKRSEWMQESIWDVRGIKGTNKGRVNMADDRKSGQSGGKQGGGQQQAGGQRSGTKQGGTQGGGKQAGSQQGNKGKRQTGGRQGQR